MTFRVAKLEDIKSVLELHYTYQIDSILEEDKKDGFVTTAFTKEELEELIVNEKGLFIALEDEKVVAYVMSASWKFWSKWAMFSYMIEDLKACEYKGVKLTTMNSYQYGPICIDKKLRGTGLLEEIFSFALEKMSKRYKYLITFVNKKNPRSMHAHRRKLGLELLKEFQYNSNEYCELICKT